MKLLELLGAKRALAQAAVGDVSVVRKLINSQRDKGKLLGSGTFGVVFKRNGYALKLWNGYDDAYTHFVTFCLRNKSNPFLPKFLSSIKEVRGRGYGENPINVNYIRMEILAPATPVSLGIPPSLFDGVSFYNNLEGVIDDSVDETEFVKRFFSGKPPSWLKGFIETGKKLHDYLGSHDHQLNDLHSGNIMMRGDQIVITDPAS